MEIATRRFLLRDFVELDRSPFLEYQADPRNLATLQGIMLIFSTYPHNFPLDAMKVQIMAEFCWEAND